MKELFIFLIFVVGLSANAEKHEHHDHSDAKHDHSENQAKISSQTKDKIVIQVKGMVCSFCAQGVEKNFNKREEVKSTKVNLDKMEVTVHLKPGKTLNEETIKSVITGAGFAYVSSK